MISVIFTGGRDYKDEKKVIKILERLDPEFVAVGDCPTGVDKYIRDYLGYYDGLKVYNADWETHGKAAGPIRNKLMCSENTTSLLVAFPGGKGTENCIKEAKKLGMFVLRVEE